MLRVSVKMADTNSVLYFAFASNLFDSRLKNGAPSATRYCRAKLKGYKMIFNKYSQKWHGGMAQLSVSPGDYVWGVVWKISEEDRRGIYQQEAVSKGVFEAKDIEVVSESGETVPCFVIYSSQPPEEMAKPSPQYKDVIVAGAKQSGLPEDYVRQLEHIEDNGYSGQTEDFATGDNL